MKTQLRSVSAACLLSVALAAAACPAVLAQGVTSRNPADVESGTFAIEPDHTQVLFGISHLQFTTYYGNFSQVSGTLTLSAKDPAASKVEVPDPVNTISTTSPKLVEILQTADWLDAARFPKMTFRSTQITRTGPGTATVVGDLTLHGVTKPVTLNVTFNAAGTSPGDQKYTVGFNAIGGIKRSDFGISKFLPFLGDDVTITISAAFVR